MHEALADGSQSVGELHRSDELQEVRPQHVVHPIDGGAEEEESVDADAPHAVARGVIRIWELLLGRVRGQGALPHQELQHGLPTRLLQVAMVSHGADHLHHGAPHFVVAVLKWKFHRRKDEGLFNLHLRGGAVDDLPHDEQRPHARPLTAALQFWEEEGQHSVRE